MSTAVISVVRGAGQDPFNSQILEQLFSQCFSGEHKTQLLGGASEPLYQPAESDDGVHALYYREDFFASALHEIAHWSLAGTQRRLQKDYGYWYSPDGRDSLAQQQFEQVEYKPQALEWIFAKGCGYPFRVSADNLDGAMIDPENGLEFRQCILKQAQQWCENGMPRRALSFFQALCEAYGQSAELHSTDFSLQQLDRDLWVS